MPILDEVVKAMQVRMIREWRRMRSTGAEIHKLTDAYHRYQDLREERKKHEQRVKRLVALLYPDYMPQNSDTATLGKVIASMDFAPARGDLALWEVLEEYLAAVGETPIADAAEMLPRFVKSHVSRQAVESAIRRHPTIFQVRLDRGKRLISLK
jgi:hypothetical protein